MIFLVRELKNRSSKNTCENSFLGKGLDSLPVGAMIIDQRMRVIFANKALSECFVLNPCDFGKISLSNVLQCGRAENGEACCGFASRCKECAVRKLINNIYEKTVPAGGTEFQCTYVKDGVRQNRWFRLDGNQVVYDGWIFALLSFEDITAYKQRETQLLEKLRLDMATETLNKYSLAEYINWLGKSEKSIPFTICMIDFDDFKKINDCYGHITGDKVLNTFSEISRKNIRSSDIIGRYGGEEFVFVFMETDLKNALHIIHRIQNELRTYFSDILEHPVTFSAGLMYVGESQCQNRRYTDLIDQVDKLLYKAKRNGKNSIVTSDCILE